jgi:CBS domain-containing protein
MWSNQTGSLLVMDSDDLRGIITERDIMKAVARGLDPAATPVSSVMTRDVLTVAPDTPLYEAARHMAARWIRHLPVVDGDTVVGIVSQRDLVGVFAALSKDPDAVELATDELVSQLRLVRIEHGDLD